jgi:hypothetical protein
MKRKELYQFVREEIINELKLTEDTIQYTDDKGQDTIANINPTSPEGVKSIETLKKDPKTKKVINTTKDQKIKESELEEMARIPNKIRLGDAAKIALAKELYGPETIEGRLIAAIEGSEGGLTQKELGAALGITIDSKLNPLIQKLAFAQVLAKPAKAATTEPEPTVEPETDEELPTLDSDEEPVDDYEKPEEEESVPEEPVSDKDIAAAAKGISIAPKVDPKQVEFISKVKEISQKIKKIKDPVMYKVKLEALKKLINRPENKAYLTGYKLGDITYNLIK